LCQTKSGNQLGQTPLAISPRLFSGYGFTGVKPGGMSVAELFVRFTHSELFGGQHALGLHECAEWPPHWFVFILAIEKKGVRFETFITRIHAS